MPENTITVKPSQPGGIVRFPDEPARTLAPEGEAVPRSAYWTRRLTDESVVEVQSTPSTKSTTSTKEAK